MNLWNRNVRYNDLDELMKYTFIKRLEVELLKDISFDIYVELIVYIIH